MSNIVFDKNVNNFLLIDFENSLKICGNNCEKRGDRHKCGNVNADINSFGRLLLELKSIELSMKQVEDDDDDDDDSLSTDIEDSFDHLFPQLIESMQNGKNECDKFFNFFYHYKNGTIQTKKPKTTIEDMLHYIKKQKV